MNNPNINPKSINPLKRICMTIGQLPSSYLETMNYYEMLVWFVEFLKNQIIPTLDNNAEAVRELQQLYIELKNYVENYFDNLDIQEEINNKLDEMVEDGTLETLIAKYVDEKCEFIYPGQWGPNGVSGNSNIIKIKNKIILIDTNSSTMYQYLKNMLLTNNITHIDYLIITHFDSDHRGNIESLIDDGYIDENSIYIHPSCITQIYGSAIEAWYNNIELLCENNNIESVIPTENEIINITNNFSLRFGNLDVEYSLANYTETNELSMIIETKHNNFCSLFMGDALTKTEKYLYDTGFIKNEISFYNIPHHAIENHCYTLFYELINPKIAIAQAQNGQYNKNLFTLNQSSALLEEKGCINYFSFNNPTNIHFIESNGDIICSNGIPLPHSGQMYDTMNIYCDSVHYNVTKQDGSEQYPFKDLPQALGIIRDWNNQHINIILKNGTYGNSYVDGNSLKNRCSINNRKNYIMIQGESRDNVIIQNGFGINNSFNVYIRDLTIKPNILDNTCLYSLASNIILNNCKVEGVNEEPYSTTGIYGVTLSNIKVLNCQFDKLENCYRILSGSTLKTNGDLLTNITNFIRCENGTSIDIGKYNSNTDFSTIENFEYSSANIFSNSQKLSQTVTNVMTGDINLNIKSNNNVYKYICINYSLRYNGSTIGKSTKILPFINNTTLLINDQNIRNEDNIDTATMVFSISDKKITIAKNIIARITSTGGFSVLEPETASDTANGILITSIDYV